MTFDDWELWSKSATLALLKRGHAATQEDEDTVRTYTYPDGTLELRVSSAVGGPDAVCALRFGTTYLYARLGASPWRRVTSRSMHSAAVLCGAAETGAEALEAITEEDG